MLRVKVFHLLFKMGQTWWISRSAVPSVICWIACDFFSSYHFWVPAVYSKVGPRRQETTALMFKVCFVLLWRIVKFLPSAFVWCFRWAPCPASQPDPVSMTSTWTRSQRRSLGSSEHAVQGNPQRYYHAYINIKYVISYVSFLSHWVRLQSEATLSLSPSCTLLNSWSCFFFPGRLLCSQGPPLHACTIRLILPLRLWTGNALLFFPAAQTLPTSTSP